MTAEQILPREFAPPKAIPPPPPADVSVEEPAKRPHAPVAEESAARVPPPIERQEVTITQEPKAPTEEDNLAAALARAATLAHQAALQREDSAAEEDLVELVTEETCEIAIWKGYAKARFYARLDDPEFDEELAVAESPTFRFRGNGIPERTEGADAAYAALIEKLLAGGWEPEGSADPWYTTRLRRAIAAEHQSV